MAEKEYIERGALLTEYDRVHVGPPGGARKLIEEAPAVEVAPVRHGRYIPDMNYQAIGNCSLCNADLKCFDNYCPNCGAKMDIGEAT